MSAGNKTRVILEDKANAPISLYLSETTTTFTLVNQPKTTAKFDTNISLEVMATKVVSLRVSNCEKDSSINVSILNDSTIAKDAIKIVSLSNNDTSTVNITDASGNVVESNSIKSETAKQDIG